MTDSINNEKVYTSKACGKLYWAGEYAVTIPNNTAIIKNVQKTLTASIKKSTRQGHINTGISNTPIPWSYKNGLVHFERDKEREYIYDTIHVMSEYLNSLNIELQCFDLSISSELKNEENIKYGFGSSAAIVVAIVKCISFFYEINLSKLEIFKLSSIVSIMMGSNSSMGDIAAATYEDLIAYTSFDRDDIRQKLKYMSIYDIVQSDWKYLNIEVLQNKLDMECLIAWTKHVADSSELVDKISRIKNTDYFENFVKNSQSCVKNIRGSIINGDKKTFIENIEKNRILLSELGKTAGAEIETDKLKELADIAKKYNECAKLSGAGGGDCGIAFVFEKNNKEKIITEFKNIDIINLGNI